MYLTEHFGLSLGALVVWGFMMAFFFNLFLWFCDLKKDIVLLLASTTIFISYFLSDHFLTWFSGSDTYLYWSAYDILTLCIVFLPQLFLKKSNSSAFKYFTSHFFVLGHTDKW